MVWFRQAASHYPSQCRQIYVAILRPIVLSNCHNINGDFRITDPFVRRHRAPVIGGSYKTQWCGAFVFALFLVWITRWTNSRVAHGWRRHDANVIILYWLLVIFKMLSGPNGLILQNILKMLIAWQRKLHWLLWILILPFKDGKLFMINLSSAMPADSQSIESTRPSTSLMSTM